VKKWCGLKSLGEKGWEIKGGGQEMAAMMLTVALLLKFISINIIAVAATFDFPPFFTQAFKATSLFTAWLFLDRYNY